MANKCSAGKAGCLLIVGELSTVTIVDAMQTDATFCKFIEVMFWLFKGIPWSGCVSVLAAASYINKMCVTFTFKG